jgi:putative nucleotidyltransferase with HDIG domain
MNINTIINKVTDLPSLPEVVIQLNELLKDNSSALDIVTGIIEKDAGLSTKVLRLANSSYYGLSSQVDSVSRAIIVLGFNTVCNVTMSVGVSALFKQQKKGVDIDMSGLWIHTLGCAVSSKVIMKKKNEMESEKAFVCGILHDIGKVVIAHAVPEEQRKILSLMTNSGKTLIQAETEVLGADHAEIGYTVAKKWRFPDYILEVIRHHHLPSAARTVPEMTSAVHLGNAISKALSFGGSTENRVTSVDSFAWKQLGIKESDIPLLITDIQNEFDLAMEFWMMD